MALCTCVESMSLHLKCLSENFNNIHPCPRDVIKTSITDVKKKKNK